LFHTSKTAKMIKVILLRAPCQNVNVLLSNIHFIIFAVFDVRNNAQLPLTVINWSFFYYICCFFPYFQAILSILKVEWQYVINCE